MALIGTYIYICDIMIYIYIYIKGRGIFIYDMGLLNLSILAENWSHVCVKTLGARVVHTKIAGKWRFLSP